MRAPTDRLGSLDQVALASQRPVVALHPYDGIHVRLLPDRGLDIGAAWFHGIPLAWLSALGEDAPRAEDWRTSWGGGLLTTCGLDNVGAPSEGLDLHGTYTFLGASGIEVTRSPEAVACTATIDDPRGLRVERTIRSDVGRGRLELVDRTTNTGSESCEAPVLYHINLGWPLWDDGAVVETDADEVVPRDEQAVTGDWRRAPGPTTAGEWVWEHHGATAATVTNENVSLAIRLSFDLPRLWQWIDPTPGVYAMALEPANCSVLGRAHDRAEGRLPFLAPGESRIASVVIEAELTDP